MKALWFEGFLLGETGDDGIKKKSILEGQLRLRSLEIKLESRGEDGLNMYKGGIANIWSCWPRRKEENSGSAERAKSWSD